jgi:hypothetical protein
MRLLSRRAHSPTLLSPSILLESGGEDSKRQDTNHRHSQENPLSRPAFLCCHFRYVLSFPLCGGRGRVERPLESLFSFQESLVLVVQSLLCSVDTEYELLLLWFIIRGKVTLRMIKIVKRELVFANKEMSHSSSLESFVAVRTKEKTLITEFDNFAPILTDGEDEKGHWMDEESFITLSWTQHAARLHKTGTTSSSTFPCSFVSPLPNSVAVIHSRDN